MADMMSMAAMFIEPVKSTGKSKQRKEDDEFKKTDHGSAHCQNIDPAGG